jgi:hypothetical protein
VVLFFIGLFIAVVFNVDTIHIAKRLSKDPELRGQMIQYADSYLKTNPGLLSEMKKRQTRIDSLLSSTKDSSALQKEREKSDSLISIIQRNEELAKEARALIQKDLANIDDLVGLGWEPIPNNGTVLYFITRQPSAGWKWSVFIGWIVTALALSMGAPFWFDLLNKLMKLRGSVVKKSEPDSTPASNVSPAAISPSVLQRKG